MRCFTQLWPKFLIVVGTFSESQKAVITKSLVTEVEKSPDESGLSFLRLYLLMWHSRQLKLLQQLNTKRLHF